MPEDANRPREVWLKDHGPVGFTFQFLICWKFSINFDFLTLDPSVKLNILPHFHLRLNS